MQKHFSAPGSYRHLRHSSTSLASAALHGMRRVSLVVAMAGFLISSVQAEQTDAVDAVAADYDNTLLGDIGGVRSALAPGGVSLSVQEISEYFGNVSGGIHQGFQYNGLTNATLQLDTAKAFGLEGGLLNISALQIHGTNLSTDNLSTLQTASGVQANRSNRLWELWYQQKFMADDRIDVRVGQQSLDQEFMLSASAQYFVNSAFGWPILPATDLPGGGPAYPLASLGARVSARPMAGVTLLAGVFSATPVSNASGDPQMQNRHGTGFPLGRGTLSIAEAQFSDPATSGTAGYGSPPQPEWRYRVGAWYSTQSFADQRFDDGGLSLSNPDSSNVAVRHHGNYAWYVVGDHYLWHDAQNVHRGIAVFFRAMGTPLKDRNTIDAGLNLGIVWHAPFNTRSDDLLGFALGYAHVSSRTSALDRDSNAFNGTANPVRSSEKFIELTYQFQATPWLQLQPDIQYVFRPGAGLVDPGNSQRRIRDEMVLGVRSTISF